MAVTPPPRDRLFQRGADRIDEAAWRSEEDVPIATQTEMLDVLGNVIGIVSAAVGAIGAISLVGAIATLTIMWIAVGERTAEIGLAEALWASHGQILAIFLAEATMLAAAGGLSRLAAGVGLAAAIPVAMPAVPVGTSGAFVGAALVVSLRDTLSIGTLPARRAARLDPVAALAGR